MYQCTFYFNGSEISSNVLICKTEIVITIQIAKLSFAFKFAVSADIRFRATIKNLLPAIFIYFQTRTATVFSRRH